MYGENFKFRTYITEFAAVQERALRMLKIMQKHGNNYIFQKTAQNFLPKYNKFKRFEIPDKKNY